MGALRMYRTPLDQDGAPAPAATVPSSSPSRRHGLRRGIWWTMDARYAGVETIGWEEGKMYEKGSPSTAELVALLRRGTDHLINMAKGMEIAWHPASGDPRRVHNMYVRNLVTSYVSRFSELSNGVLIGLDNRDYLIYALCGRSLIETTAILRYGRPLAFPGGASSATNEMSEPLLGSGSIAFRARIAGTRTGRHVRLTATTRLPSAKPRPISHVTASLSCVDVPTRQINTADRWIFLAQSCFQSAS